MSESRFGTFEKCLEEAEIAILKTDNESLRIERIRIE